MNLVPFIAIAAVRDEYRFERRELEVKGLGPMTTYLLDDAGA